jgi:glycosyltransferase involved in cell wall biosynthesis
LKPPRSMNRRILIVSRIFSPEPSAASMRLDALARELACAGHSVVVLTSRAPHSFEPAAVAAPGIRIRRAPVLRDKMGYIRGYVQYMSFDVPALFRVLFSRPFSAMVVEPPPTTGVFMRVAAALRRRPYFYYAADIWSDASVAAGVPRFVSRTVRAMERWTLNGARAVLSVSDDVTARLRELEVSAPISTVGNGVDTMTFSPHGESRSTNRPYFLYAGTASEVHGASIFVDAFARITSANPGVDLVFLGQGSERNEIERSASVIGEGRVRFLARVEPKVAAEWIRGAVATLASVRADHYELGFPTKMYASVACGAPVIYAGTGPGKSFAEQPHLGFAVAYDVEAIAQAMIRALQTGETPAERSARATWAHANVSISAVAARVRETIEGASGAPAHPRSTA